MIAPLFEAEEMMFSKSDQTEEYYTNEKVYKRRKDILDSTFNHLSSVTQKGDIQCSLYSIVYPRQMQNQQSSYKYETAFSIVDLLEDDFDQIHI